MPFAWVIIVILWWAISAISKAKKNQATQTKLQADQEKSRQKTAQQYAQHKAKPQAAPKPVPQPAAPAMSRQDEWEDEEKNWDQRDAQRVRPSRAAQPAQAAPVKRHETKPLETHMHTPVMGIEGEGTEGIDCCHEYMLDQPAEQPADFLPMQEETENLRAKALLQGVIYSEILGRRPMKRYGRKSA